MPEFTYTGFVEAPGIRAATGYTSKNEDAARSRSGVQHATTFEVVTVATLTEAGVKLAKDGPAYFTKDEALALLPSIYSPLTEANGDVRPAGKSVRVNEVKGYLASEVAGLRAAVAEIEEEREAARIAKQKATKARRTAWLNGDEGVYLTADDVRLFEDVRDAGRYTGGGAGNIVRPFTPLPPGAVILPKPNADGDTPQA